MLSHAQKLSTIFVDNIVHSLYKQNVSGVFISIFCSAIKKYTSRLNHINHGFTKRPRVAAGFRGGSCFDFVTVVDEGRYFATDVKGSFDEFCDRRFLLRARLPTRVAQSGGPEDGRAGLECGA